MNTELRQQMQKNVESIRSLPSCPAVLQPLLKLLRLPPDQIDVKRVVELVSYEKTIAAQCLRIANSPLYARARPAESIEAAVFSLGMQRVEDILLGHCFSQLIPQGKWAVDPNAFWRHSFGCALVCKQFAERIGYPDVDKAYLAGLLHDLGILVNSLIYTKEYRALFEEVVKSGRPLHEQEQETLGFTHSDSGAILARAWQLPPSVAEVIEWHHDVEHGPVGNALIALTHLADQLCRLRGLGYGYEEWRTVDLPADPAWMGLTTQCPQLASMDLARFTMDMDADVIRISELVDAIFSRS